eukprot:CAMPEP_0169227122 /NCGR_PEP_ID=MMETSP1016-20121227/24131_1 /TAXON_ID=342587 /ORGANISM="Karlodinium micrum, Strain CCMP2283" /LENGTH=259 /DNA_ID=CAMNT_0009305811 /DNA_START=65 /DNA_END=845 /DNA_ORIENTATION=+
MVLVTVSMLVFSTIATSYAQTQGAPSKKLRGSKVQKNTTQSGCHGSFCDGVPDQKFAVLLEKGIVSIHIGESKTANEKCVAHPTPVTCAKDAANPGKRLNDKNVDYGDKFAITVKKDSREVCAQRLDKNEGWGQPLKIACKDAQEKSDKCMCLTSAEGDCSCKGCTEDEQMQTCFELLDLALASDLRKPFAIVVDIATREMNAEKHVKLSLGASGLVCGAKPRWDCSGAEDSEDTCFATPSTLRAQWLHVPELTRGCAE